MGTRPPADEIIKELTTTADKIRALANASYDRTEISQVLGISYQHVRNVLLRSGITGGLRRQVDVERVPVTVDAGPPPREDTSWEVLTQAGFKLLGEWTRDSESSISFNGQAPIVPGVYAFVVDDIVIYVGLTLNGLRARFDQHRRGHMRQRTSARIKALIDRTLMEVKRVRVLAATPEPLEWRDLPVNTAAGCAYVPECGMYAALRHLKIGWVICEVRLQGGGPNTPYPSCQVATPSPLGVGSSLLGQTTPHPPPYPTRRDTFSPR